MSQIKCEHEQKHEHKRQRIASNAATNNEELPYSLSTADASRELREDGYTVVPMLDDADVQRFADMVHADMRHYPEFRPASDTFTPQYVMGVGDCALSNPASFHGEGVRELRVRADDVVRQVMCAVLADADQREEIVCEQLFERLVLRRGHNVVRVDNKLHRDPHTPAQVRLPRNDTGELFSNDENIVCESKCTYTSAGNLFGGWVNLNASGADQYFTCVPQSHRYDDDDNNKHAHRRVPVPPGHLIIFHHRLLHSDHVRTPRSTELRLRIAFNVTRTNSPKCRALFGNRYKRRVICQHETPLLPSGHLPAMYAQRFLATHSYHLSLWARRSIHSRFLTSFTFNSADNPLRTGQCARLPYRFLVRLHSQTLPPYSRSHANALVPKRLFP